MLFDKYEQDGLLFNMNFNSPTSQEGVSAYRGELILIEGEITDEQGRRKPPIAIMRHTVMLAKEDKLTMLVGCLDSLSLLENLLAKYETDFAPEMSVMLFVVDITTSMQLEINGINFFLIPLADGIAWNELIEELGLEKSDFKGQSAADKIVTAYDELKSHKPKYKIVSSFDEALTLTADIKREARGPV